MSTATELLRRAIDDLELQVGQSIDEIRAFLDPETEAEPLNGAILPNGSTATNVYEAYEEGLKEGKVEQEAEPVAWISTNNTSGDKWLEYHKVTSAHSPDLYSHEPLYTRPEPARKPMTEEYIRILYGDDNNFELTAPYVIAFARAVERYHGIKKDDEFCDSHCTWLDHHPDCKQFIPKTEAKNPPLATAIGQAVKITENGDHIAYEIFDGDKWLRLEPAIRKPMTEEEIQKGVKRLKEMVGNKSSEVYAAFEVGIRVAEKHHEIGGDDGQ